MEAEIKENYEKLRQSKEDVLKNFYELKKNKKLEYSNLTLLLNNCNIIEEIIVYYLDYLKDSNVSNYKSELLYYYPIISPECCKNYGIMKISEKNRFYDIMDSFLKGNSLLSIAYIEFSTCAKEVLHFFESEIKDLKDQEEIEKIKKRYIRWDNIYNVSIDFKDIYNEEYFYYKLSNSILREYYEGKIGIHTRDKGIKLFLELFKVIEPKKKLYPNYFEFTCLGLLNLEIKENNQGIKHIIKNIHQELMEKNLDLNSIKEIFDAIHVKYKINNNQITIIDNDIELIIDDYRNYNLSIKNILTLLGESTKESFEINLKSIRYFSSYMNKDNDFDGLLIKTILNYAKSHLSKDSIEKLFKIKMNNYTKLFQEVNTDNILNYLFFIPYNNSFDTARTLKIYNKIIMDLNKNLFNQELDNILLSTKLLESLKKLVNIVRRKYNFEHEQHHFVTILLFYLYLNEKRRINSLPKEINDNDVEILNDQDYENKKEKKNVKKEAGHLFEIFCYGNVQTKFTLNQILFIANEQNDNLDCSEYKNNYMKYEEIDKLLKNFPEDQPLSSLVKEIQEGLEEEKDLIKKRTNQIKTSDDIFRNIMVSKIEERDKPVFLTSFENIYVDKDEEAYNNHLYDRRSDVEN